MRLTVIQKKIYMVDGQRVMLDFDIADLYQVETRVLNQAVKRNLARFPKDFMFQLTKKQWEGIKPQLVVQSDLIKRNSSQIVMSSKKHRGKSYLPFAFTEHGVTMLASVLRSARAIKMNIFIVRAFVTLRQFALNYEELARQLKELHETVGEHDKNIIDLYKAIESLIEEKQKIIDWENRERIGFKKDADDKISNKSQKR